MDQKPIAALVPFSTALQESWKEGMAPQFVEIIERARAEIRSEKKHSLDDLKREFGVA
jgi:F0F1-type ATP synthase membrane subunit b/b'